MFGGKGAQAACGRGSCSVKPCSHLPKAMAGSEVNGCSYRIELSCCTAACIQGSSRSANVDGGSCARQLMQDQRHLLQVEAIHVLACLQKARCSKQVDEWKTDCRRTPVPVGPSTTAATGSQLWRWRSASTPSPPLPLRLPAARSQIEQGRLQLRRPAAGKGKGEGAFASSSSLACHEKGPRRPRSHPHALPR